MLLILAVDHRAGLERDLYGLTAPPSPAKAARISADKLLVYQVLLDAAGQLPANVQPGVLIDEQYGASIVELVAHSGGAVSLCMPSKPAARNGSVGSSKAGRLREVRGRGWEPLIVRQRTRSTGKYQMTGTKLRDCGGPGLSRRDRKDHGYVPTPICATRAPA